MKIYYHCIIFIISLFFSIGLSNDNIRKPMALFNSLYSNDEWKVIVSIADVSHYVQENSNLDTHAKERGNSIYFPNFVIPMLPEKLSNDLCSLKENKLRLTLSVEIILDSEGNKLSHKFFKSTIKSAKRFTYNDVNNLIKTKFKKNKSVFVNPKDVDLGEEKFDKNNIIGYDLFSQEEENLGKVSAVIKIKNNNLIQLYINDKEVLLPYNEKNILALDHSKKQMKLDIPDGLIELYTGE